MAVKLIEFETKVTADVKKTDVLKVLVKSGWFSCKTKPVKIKLAEDIKKGDSIKIHIEKL